MDSNQTLSLTCNVLVETGDLQKSITRKMAVNLEGHSLSSAAEIVDTVNHIEADLVTFRQDLFHAVFQVLLALAAALLNKLAGEDITSRCLPVVSIFGNESIPVCGISFEEFGLRKKLHTAEVLKILGNSIISQSYRNTTDDFNRQQHRTDEDALKHRTVANTINDMGSSAFTCYKSEAHRIIDPFVTWAKSKSLLFPTIPAEVAKAQGWVYEPCTDPEIICAYEELVQKTADAINEQTRKKLTESKQKKYGDKFDIDRLEATIQRRIIRAQDALRLLERPDEKVVYIMIDGIVSHQQKNKRGVPKRISRWTNNNVAYVEVDGYRHVLVAKTMDELCTFILALLIENDLLDRRLVFFADGATEINNAIETCFNFTTYDIILDWYHLREKIYDLTSMWVRGTKARKGSIGATLRAYLWAGRVDSAISYLESFNEFKDATTNEEIEKSSEIRNAAKYLELLGYLTRKGTYIPCYALRKEFGLLNSSNCVEQTNNVMIATRQKNNGMSWSKKGSLAVAVVTMMKRNRSLDSYITTHKVSFKFAGVKVGGKRAKAIRARLAAA